MQSADLGLAQLSGLFAIWAKTPNESLRHDRADRGGDQKWLDPEVHQAGHGRCSVVGVQGAENEVTCQACIRCDRRRLQVANFTDHDYVRCLAQNGTQRDRKGQPDIRIYLHLIDAVHPVLDRLLDRDDFAVGFVDEIEAGIERARLAGTGRPRHEQNPVRQAKQSLEPLLIVAEKSKVREPEH